MTNVPRVFAVELGPKDLDRLCPGQGWCSWVRFAAYVDGEPLRLTTPRARRIVRTFATAALAEQAGADELARDERQLVLAITELAPAPRNTPALACGVRRARRKGDG